MNNLQKSQLERARSDLKTLKMERDKYHVNLRNYRVEIVKKGLSYSKVEGLTNLIRKTEASLEEGLTKISNKQQLIDRYEKGL